MVEARRKLDEILGPRFTRIEVAEHFGKSEKWLRRLLPLVRGLEPMQTGSTMLFTADDVRMIEAHLRCQCTLAASDKASGMREVRSGSAKRRSSSRNTAQDAVREWMLTHKPRRTTEKSGRTSLQVVRGGRDG